MATTDEILTALAANLAQPKRARTDAGEIEQHDLAAQIAAAKFAIAMGAVSGNTSPFRSLRNAQLVMGNANGSPDPQTGSIGTSGLPGYPW